MVDADALFKLRLANIDVGSSSPADTTGAGRPCRCWACRDTRLLFHSYRDDAYGGDTDPNDNLEGARSGIGPAWYSATIRITRTQGIFLNWVAQADIRHGGGKAFVDNQQVTFAPIHLVDARPAIVYSTITQNAEAAISANPNSFDDQIPGNTDPRLSRIGPDVHGNTVTQNKVNGLFVRIETSFRCPDRYAQQDGPVRRYRHRPRHQGELAHRRQSGGAPGHDRADQRPPGGGPGRGGQVGPARIEALRSTSSLIAEGTADRRIVFTSVEDDRYGMGGDVRLDQ